MAPYLDELIFRTFCSSLQMRGFCVEDHDDPQTQKSYRVTRDAQVCHVSLFGTGTIRVLPPAAQEVRQIYADVERVVRTLHAAIVQETGRDAFEFLEEIDRDYALATQHLLEKKPELMEHSAVVMPLAKAFEGFAKKLLTRLGVGDPARVDEPTFFREAFGSRAFANFLKDPRDRRILERLQNSLPFSRHGLMHSPPKPEFVLRGHHEAVAKAGEIKTLIRETYEHFRGRV